MASGSQKINEEIIDRSRGTSLWGEVRGSDCDQSTSHIKKKAAEEIKDVQVIKRKMLERIANSDAHFKHQQRGDPDLSQQEKFNIAEEILNKNTVTFLSRFGNYLALEDLEYFKDQSSEYEVNFYLQQIKQQCNKRYSENRVKNRRYEAMKQLISQGDYFSEDEMKFRDPYLYEQLVGQYLTEEEINSKVDKSDLKFSSILLKHMDQLTENDLYAKHLEKEASQMEEEDESSDEDEEMSEGENDSSKPEKLSEILRQELRGEFAQIMQERFLAGQDEQFDYSSVDCNAEYDNLEVLEKDEEEKYFDSEEPVDLEMEEELCDSKTAHLEHCQNSEVDDSKVSETKTQNEERNETDIT